MKQPILCLFLGVVCLPLIGLAQDFVVVEGQGINIRSQPSTTGEIVAQAQEGDVFDLVSTKGDWFEIGMFSGEYRYIHNLLARKIGEVSPLPRDRNVRRSACFEIARAQDRASSESERRYPTDFMKQIDLERLLYDRYELPIFRKYGIAPAHNSTLIGECAQNRWFP